MKVVVDASVVVKWLLPEEHHTEARALLQLVGRVEELSPLIAPEILIAEVGHALRRQVNRSVLTPNDAEYLFGEILPEFPIDYYFLRNDMRYSRVGHLADDAMRIGNLYQFSFYDSIYIALALQVGEYFATADRKLFDRLSSTGLQIQPIWVEAIPEWVNNL